MRFFAHAAAITLLAIGGTLLAPDLRAAVQLTHRDENPKAMGIDEMAKLFRSSCATCHLPPDPAHGMDNAWLNQVTDTA